MAAGTLTVRVVGDTAPLKKALGDAGRDADTFGGKMNAVGSKMQSVGKKATIGLTLPIVAGIGLALKALGNMARIQAQTEATIKSTGGAANVTGKQVAALADGIEKLTGLEAENVQEGANLLLTFTNLRNGVGKGNDIFDQSTRVLADMSVALGQDTKSSAIQLGKALNDPIKGVTALQRVGVSFTKAQKDQIKALVESGDVMGAQKLILKELNTEFGGSAKAYGKTMPGQIAKAKNAFGEMTESLVVSLMPAVTTITRLVQSLAAKFQSLTPTQQKVIVITALVVAALGPLVGLIGTVIKVVKGLSVAMSFLAANPIVLVIAALVALGAGLVIAYQKSETFRTVVNGVFEGVKITVRTVVDTILGLFEHIITGAAKAFGWVPGIGPKLKAAAKAFEQFRDDVNGALSGIKNKKITLELAGAPGWSVTGGRPPTEPGAPGWSVTGGTPPRRAMGGPVSAGRGYMVGEEGPELFVPGGSGQVVANDRIKAGHSITINHYGPGEALPHEILWQLGRIA